MLKVITNACHPVKFLSTDIKWIFKLPQEFIRGPVTRFYKYQRRNILACNWAPDKFLRKLTSLFQDSYQKFSGMTNLAIIDCIFFSAIAIMKGIMYDDKNFIS